MRDGDLAGSVARQLQSDHLAEILASGETFIEDPQSVMLNDNKKSIFSKIDFKWRPEDLKILEQMRASVDTMMNGMYGRVKGLVDDLHSQFRVPEIDPDTGEILMSHGRIVWLKDENGKEVEEWGQMTNMDIEKTLFLLVEAKLDLTCSVNELMLEAVFARHVLDEKFQEAYAELIEDTIPGRNAHAARKSRIDKYHAFYRYYLWSSAKVLLDELSNFTRLLERIRYWRQESSGS